MNANSIFDDGPRARLSLRERMSMKLAFTTGSETEISKVPTIDDSQSRDPVPIEFFESKKRTGLTNESVIITPKGRQNLPGTIELSVSTAARTTDRGREEIENASSQRRSTRRVKDDVQRGSREQGKSQGRPEATDTTLGPPSGAEDGDDGSGSKRRRTRTRSDEQGNCASVKASNERNKTEKQNDEISEAGEALQSRGDDKKKQASHKSEERNVKEQSACKEPITDSTNVVADREAEEGAEKSEPDAHNLGVVVGDEISIENLESSTRFGLRLGFNEEYNGLVGDSIVVGQRQARLASTQIEGSANRRPRKLDQDARRTAVAPVSVRFASSMQKNRKESADTENGKLETAFKVNLGETEVKNSNAAKAEETLRQRPAVKEKPKARTEARQKTIEGEPRHLADPNTVSPLENVPAHRGEGFTVNPADSSETLYVECHSQRLKNCDIAQLSNTIDSKVSEKMIVNARLIDSSGPSIEVKSRSVVKNIGDGLDEEMKVSDETRHRQDVQSDKNVIVQVRTSDHQKNESLNTSKETQGAKEVLLQTTFTYEDMTKSIKNEDDASMAEKKDLVATRNGNDLKRTENEEEINRIDEILTESSSSVLTDEVACLVSKEENEAADANPPLYMGSPSKLDKIDVKYAGKVDLKPKAEAPEGGNNRKVGQKQLSGKFDFKSHLKSNNGNPVAMLSAKSSLAPSKLDVLTKSRDREKAVVSTSRAESRESSSRKEPKLENRDALTSARNSECSESSSDMASKLADGDVAANTNQCQSASKLERKILESADLASAKMVEITCVTSAEAKVERDLATYSADQGKALPNIGTSKASSARGKFEAPKDDQKLCRDFGKPSATHKFEASLARNSVGTSAARSKFDSSQEREKCDAAGSKGKFETGSVARKSDSNTSRVAKDEDKQSNSDLPSSKKALDGIVTTAPCPVVTPPNFIVAVDGAVETEGNKATSRIQDFADTAATVTVVASCNENLRKSTDLHELTKTQKQAPVATKVTGRPANGKSDLKATSRTKPGNSIEAMMEEKKRQQGMEKKLQSQQRAKGKNAFKAQLEANAPKLPPGQIQVQSQGDGNIEKLLKWVAKRVNRYPGVNVTNFTTSWSDGVAFCALLNFLLGNEAIPPGDVSGEDRRKNFELAFSVAEKHGVPSLLDVDDMCRSCDPDRHSVITYVHLIYKILFADKQKPK